MEKEVFIWTQSYEDLYKEVLVADKKNIEIVANSYKVHYQ